MQYAARMKHRLFSVPQAAEYLNISKSSVWRLIAEGRIPSVQVRSRRMVPFGRIFGFKPTPVYQTEMRVAQVDLSKIVFEGLPGPKRKLQCKKNSRGKFAPKCEWPKIAREKQLDPIGRLIHDPIDLSRFS